MSQDRAFQRIYQRVVRDRAFFEGVLPLEYRSLSELLAQPRPGVRLASGAFHDMDPDELRLLASTLPWYVHRLVRLPWVFTYRREHWGGRYYLRNPDPWAARALGYLLNGSLAVERRSVGVDEMGRLLRSFKTLIIVTIEVAVTGAKAAPGHEPGG